MLSGIAKAHEISEACKDSMTDVEVMTIAGEIVQKAEYISKDELIHLMFVYSGILTANVATRITSILMSESDFDSMVSDINMFDEIEKDVLG